MKKMETKKIALMGLLTALALIASYVEILVPIPIGIPGVKLGLANLIVVWSLYTLKPKEALLVNVLRIFLVGFLFGSMFMILYSLAGAFVSFFCMWLAKRSGAFSIYGVSIIGGITHNAGQLVVAMLMLESANLIYYGPVLLIAGLLTGLLIGVVSAEVLKRVKRVR